MRIRGASPRAPQVAALATPAPGPNSPSRLPRAEQIAARPPTWPTARRTVSPMDAATNQAGQRSRSRPVTRSAPITPTRDALSAPPGSRAVTAIDAATDGVIATIPHRDLARAACAITPDREDHLLAIFGGVGFRR